MHLLNNLRCINERLDKILHHSCSLYCSRFDPKAGETVLVKHYVDDNKVSKEGPLAVLTRYCRSLTSTEGGFAEE